MKNKTIKLDETDFDALVEALDIAIEAQANTIQDAEDAEYRDHSLNSLKQILLNQAKGINEDQDEMTTVEKGRELVEFLEYMKHFHNSSISIMAHDLTDLQYLDESWELDVLRSGGGAVVTAKKDGVTLFGEL